MRSFVKYKLPPLVCMVLIFPLTNRYLSGSWIYDRITDVLRWIDPEVTVTTIGTAYTLFRKSCHFVEYGVLAYLLFRMFRGDERSGWRIQWVVYSILISTGYGILDEFVQSFIPSRNGSLLDVLIDVAGILTVVMLIWARNFRARAALGA